MLPARRKRSTKTLRALATHFHVHADSTQARGRCAATPACAPNSRRSVTSSHCAWWSRRSEPTGHACRPPRPPAADDRDRQRNGRHRRDLTSRAPASGSGTRRPALSRQQRWRQRVADRRPGAGTGDTVEALPTLPAIAAVDWPKGKSVRVLTLDSRQLGVKISPRARLVPPVRTGDSRRGAGRCSWKHCSARAAPGAVSCPWATASTPR
jgi:hypothetical protein